MSGTPVLIKTPYKKENYTADQIAEIVKSATDPIYFIREYMWIQHPTKGRVKFELYDYQIDLINTYQNNKYSINMLGRQMGKCLEKEINITVKNNKTGDIYEIPIGKFHEYNKAKRDGAELPDISQYKVIDLK